MEAPLSKGAGRVSGLGDSDGMCVAAHSRATSAREKGPGCRPPSPLLVRDPFTAVRRGRACPALHLAITTPFILCIVGRGLDRLTAHNERRQPAKLARSCGCLPCRGKHCSLPDFAPLNRGPTLTTPHLRGASGTPPSTTQSAGLLITANVRGGLGAGRPTSHFTTFRGAGLRPQLIHATPLGPGMPGPQPCHCIPFIFCIVGRGLDPSRGVGDAAPYNNPQGFSLPQTSAAAWGQAALHPTLPHSVGRAFARNSFTPLRWGRACPARSLAIASPLSFAS